MPRFWLFIKMNKWFAAAAACLPSTGTYDSNQSPSLSAMTVWHATDAENLTVFIYQCRVLVFLQNKENNITLIFVIPNMVCFNRVVWFTVFVHTRIIFKKVIFKHFCFIHSLVQKPFPTHPRLFWLTPAQQNEASYRDAASSDIDNNNKCYAGSGIVILSALAGCWWLSN